MDTIRSYLDNMFAGLPRTERVKRLRNELLSNMEERYLDLKSQGKTENEAIGIVISEFGNIDELFAELNIQKGDAPLPEATPEQVESYFACVRQSARSIAWGVFLCIMGPAMLILFNQLFGAGFMGVSNQSAPMLALIPLFLCVVPGVGMLIYGGMRLDVYKKLETDMLMPAAVRAKLESEMEAYHPSFIRSIIIGVGLCVLCPVPLFAFAAFGDAIAPYGMVILLLFVACGVQLFIRSGMLHESYQKLLKTGDYKVVKNKNDKVVSIVASIVWPLATAVFLFCGFVYNLWGTAWIIFPILGILFGIFSNVYNKVKGYED